MASESVSIPHTQSMNRGLGIYNTMPPVSQSTVTTMVTSPPTSAESWPQSSGMDQDYSAPGPPDILSIEFNPFSNISSSSSTSGMVGEPSPEAPGLDFCQTPPGSNVQSHRDSVSSYAPSDGSECAFTPRIKPEDGGDWIPSANEHLPVFHRPSQAPMPYTPGSATMPSQTEQLYRPPHSHAEDMYSVSAPEWNKHDSAVAGPTGGGLFADVHPGAAARLPPYDMTILTSVDRIKKKRQRTTKEDATHECKQCGKLFKRSYNWKSHMETHNPERRYPHVCTSMNGDSPCTKKFQRKTDLDRHHDSVHLKARNHKCQLCGNGFARRDTLRRHTEDGCPKRFELGLRDQSAALSQQQHQQQQARWSYASPASATPYGVPPRPRTFSLNVTQGSPVAMTSTSAAAPGHFPLYPPSTLGSPAFPS